MAEPAKTKSSLYINEPKPGPNDTQGLIAIFYWKDRPDKSHGFKIYFYGQKIPQEYLSASNPPKFCDKYAYFRIEKHMDKKRGLWDIVEIIDIATDTKLEQHYWSNGVWRQKIHNQYSWDLISHRDQRFRIKVLKAPQ
jgi:hypothetical protein